MHPVLSMNCLPCNHPYKFTNLLNLFFEFLFSQYWNRWNSFWHLRRFLIYFVLYVRINVPKIWRALKLQVTAALLGSSVINSRRCRNYFTLDKGKITSEFVANLISHKVLYRHGPIGWFPTTKYGILHQILFNTTFGKITTSCCVARKISKIFFSFICSDSDDPFYSFSKLLNSLSGISDLLSEFRFSHTNGEFIIC